MSQPNKKLGVGNVPTEAMLSEYVTTLRKHVYSPPNSDVYIASGAEAQLLDWELFEPVIKEALRFRAEEIDQPVNPHMFPNLVDRAYWRQAERLDPENWPRGYENVHSNRMLFRKFLPTPGVEMYETEFFYDISILSIMSNPAERKKPLQALMVLFPERFPEGLNILEVGCSANHILKALEIELQLPDTTIYGFDKRGYRRRDQLATVAFNGLMSVHPKIGKSLGVDEWPWEKDKKIRDWARVNTNTPAETLAPPRLVPYLGRSAMMTSVEQYQLLDSTNSPNVNFGWLDITSPDLVDRYLENAAPVREFDVIFLPTVMQQQSQANRMIIFEQIEKFKKDSNSLIVLQDFVQPNPDNPQELIFEEDIYESQWTYQTLIWDPKSPEAGWQVAFVHRTGRCNESCIGPARFNVDDRQVSISDRLTELKGRG